RRPVNPPIRSLRLRSPTAVRDFYCCKRMAPPECRSEPPGYSRASVGSRSDSVTCMVGNQEEGGFMKHRTRSDRPGLPRLCQRRFQAIHGAAPKAAADGSENADGAGPDQWRSLVIPKFRPRGIGAQFVCLSGSADNGSFTVPAWVMSSLPV